MAGMGAFSKCSGYPIDWSLNSQNPYDFTNYAYVKDVDHKYVEDVSIESINPDAPYGDKYLGVVGKKCEKKSTPLVSKCDDVKYIFSVKDSGLNNFPFFCIGENSDSGYGSCKIPGNYHYYEVRDWKNVMDKYGGEIYCCSMPSQYSFDKNDPWMKDLQDRDGCLVGSDPIRTMKCPPTHWPGSPLCVPVLQKYCNISENWKNKDFKGSDGTTKSFCDMYMDKGNGASQNSQNTILIGALQDWVTNELDNGNKKPDSKDSRVKTFTEHCSANTGICDDLLEVACKNITKEDVKKDSNLAKLCSCFMPDDQYTLPGIIPIECNGFCALNDSIGGVVRGYYDDEEKRMKPLKCKQTTCVIDDVTVNLINSELDGNISFDQICGSCPSGSCNCVFNDITIDGTNSVIKGNINFTQECGGCSQIGVTSDGSPTSCTGSILQKNVYTSIPKQKHNYIIYFIGLAIFVTIFLILFFVLP